MPLLKPHNPSAHNPGPHNAGPARAARLLSQDFYVDSPDLVARKLLGKLLVRPSQGLVGRIVEVEAYFGESDPAAHSSAGKTPRNAVLFGPPGFAYVYFVYGMHYCVNIVTGLDGDAQAVLIRAVVCDGVDPRLTNGPAKLCRQLGIDMSMNGDPAHVVDDGIGPPTTPVVTPRIGITKAVEWPRRWLVC